jgi:hypothetical protein
MPKRLLDRCRPDTIREFREAARQRFEDGSALALGGRRTGAIYLWGYTAEMTLKAAYFDVIGFPATQVITMADLHGARANAPHLGFTWIGNLHNLESWTKLLVATRGSMLGLAYPDPRFGNEVIKRGQDLQQLWSEYLRYHKNVAYPYEVRQVRDGAAWLLFHSSNL